MVVVVALYGTLRTALIARLASLIAVIVIAIVIIGDVVHMQTDRGSVDESIVIVAMKTERGRVAGCAVFVTDVYCD